MSELEARVINWNDYKTERDIENLEYRGLFGKAALEEAYTRIYARYDDPKTEEDIIGKHIFRPELQQMMRLYFTVHPETAQEIVDSYKEHRGIRRVCLWWEFFWNSLRGDRYKVAQERVSIEKLLGR